MTETHAVLFLLTDRKKDVVTQKESVTQTAWSYTELGITDPQLDEVFILIETATETKPIGLRGTMISDNVSVGGGKWKGTLWVEPPDPNAQFGFREFATVWLEWRNPPARYGLQSVVVDRRGPDDHIRRELAIKNALWAASVVHVTPPESAG